MLSIIVRFFVVYVIVGGGLIVVMFFAGSQFYNVAEKMGQAFLTAALGYAAILIPIHQAHQRKENKPILGGVVYELLTFVSLSCLLTGIAVAQVATFVIWIVYLLAVFLFSYITWIVFGFIGKVFK